MATNIKGSLMSEYIGQGVKDEKNLLVNTPALEGVNPEEKDNNASPLENTSKSNKNLLLG